MKENKNLDFTFLHNSTIEKIKKYQNILHFLIEREEKMKNFSTWMLVMFMILFWILRIIVAVSAELNWDLGALKPLNQQVEIILLFVVLVCVILVVKRKMLGGLIYLLAYGMYFGVDIVNN